MVCHDESVSSTVTYGQPMIDPDLSTPVYLQLAELLAAQIRAGRPPQGRPLPSITRLASDYGVAVGTVRHALAVLRARGVIHIVAGKGTYAGPAPDAVEA
jgi:DNA-binding GntR family transcriptional regulator